MRARGRGRAMARDLLASNLCASRPTLEGRIIQGWTLQAFGNKGRVQPVQPVQPFSPPRARVMPCGRGSSYFSYTSDLGWTGWTGWTQPIKSITWRVQPLFQHLAEVGQVGRDGLAGPSWTTLCGDVSAARDFASGVGPILTEHPEHAPERPNTLWQCLRLSTLATLSTRSGNLPHWENPAPLTRRSAGAARKDPRRSGARLRSPSTLPVDYSGVIQQRTYR